MGYYGRPSKNCLGCRQRRIKCDFKVPACTQCKRAGIICAGYRDQQSLIFHDETAKAQYRSVTAKDRSRGAENRSLQKALPNYPINNSLPAVPSMTIDEYGLTFFLDRFSTAPKWSIGNQLPPMGVAVHPFIHSIIFREPSRDALVSVGLAALSNTTGDKTYYTAAIQKYVASINLVRRAIQDPSQANLEDAIKVSLILMIYEFVNKSRSSLHSWGIHADGALALFRKIHNGRMPTRPEDMAGLQSYLFVIMKHFGSVKEIPQEILDWSSPQYSSPVLNTTSNLISILIRFIYLSAALKDPTSTLNASDVVEAVLAIDNDLSDWEASLVDDDWSFVTKTSDQPFGFYQEKYHIYNNVWTSRVLNHYRWSRILVNELLYIYTPKLATATNPHLIEEQQQSALTTISRLATDICISVPSHSRLFGRGFDALAASTSGGGCSNGGQADFPPLNGVFILVFALVIAGSGIGVPDELHNWVVNILGLIDSSMGIRYAGELIPVVKKMRMSKKSNFWGVMHVWELPT